MRKLQFRSSFKQAFIVLLSFSKSLASVAKVSDRTKCVPLNVEPRMVRPTLIDLNPVELKYYPFMISLDKCSGSYNDLSSKVCVPKKKTKYINVKVFNMITNKNETKSKNIFHVNVNVNSIVQHVIQIKNGVIKRANMNAKIIVRAKIIMVGILANVLVRIASF